MYKNIFREIKIKSHNSGSAGISIDWRYNLQRILEGDDVCKDADKGGMLSNNLSRNSVVPSSVWLPMPDESPEFSTSNSWSTNFLDHLSTGGASLKDKLGNLGTLLSNGFQTLVSSKTIYDAISNRLDGKDETSSVWNPWFSQVPTFDSVTNGFAFPLKFEFALGQFGLWDAKSEVVLPILNLIAPALPRQISSLYMNGPGPNLIDLIMGITETDDSSKFEDRLQSMVLKKYNKFTFDITLGNFITLENCLLENAKWKFSSEVDTSGYPIKGECTLDFITIIPMALTSSAKSSSEHKRAVKFGGGN